MTALALIRQQCDECQDAVLGNPEGNPNQTGGIKEGLLEQECGRVCAAVHPLLFLILHLELRKQPLWQEEEELQKLPFQTPNCDLGASHFLVRTTKPQGWCS